MGTGAVAQDFIGDHLIGISEVEIAFLHPCDRCDIQGRSNLVVQETIRQPEIVIILEIVKAEFSIKVGHRTAITFEPLEEDRRFEFDATVLFHKAIPRIHVVVP